MIISPEMIYIKTHISFGVKAVNPSHVVWQRCCCGSFFVEEMVYKEEAEGNLSLQMNKPCSV